MLRIMALAALAIGTSASAAPPHYPQTATLDGSPTAAEAATIRGVLLRSIGKEWSDYLKSSGHAPNFAVGHADLNGDGRADLLVSLNDGDFGYCGSAGCAGYAILATPTGYGDKSIDLATFYEKVTVLPAVHNGMHDLRYDDARKIFVWGGGQYR